MLYPIELRALRFSTRSVEAIISDSPPERSRLQHLNQPSREYCSRAKSFLTAWPKDSRVNHTVSGHCRKPANGPHASKMATESGYTTCSDGNSALLANEAYLGQDFRYLRLLVSQVPFMGCPDAVFQFRLRFPPQCLQFGYVQ